MSVQRVSRTSRPPRPGIDWLNKVGQAVNDHEQRSKTFGPRAARPVSKETQALIVLVKNTTEDTIGQYRPLDLDGTVPHEQDIVLKGIAGAGGRCVITQEPIPAGGIGRAAISGMTKAWVTGTTGSQVSSGDGVMEMGSGLAEVLYDSDDAVTTERIAILLMAAGSPPCANYYIFAVEGGPTAGTVGWSVIDLTDDSTVVSGTYTMGDATSTLVTAINTALGFTVPISGGPLPANEITLNLNRGRSDTRYEFRITSQSLTPQTDGFAYAKVAACCVVGG